MSDTIRKALEAAEQALAHSYEVQFNPAEGTSEQDAALAAVRAALAQPQAAQPEAVAWPSKMKSEPLRADESVQDQECALRFVQGWNACLEACKSAATPPTEPAPQADKPITSAFGGGGSRTKADSPRVAIKLCRRINERELTRNESPAKRVMTFSSVLVAEGSCTSTLP